MKYLNFSCFKDYTSVKYYTSIRPGQSKGDPTVTDIRCLKYTPDSTIQFKINYGDQWANLPNKNRKIIDFDVKNLYKEEIKIKEEKFLHLQQLKQVLPKHAWPFYENLHYTKNKKSDKFINIKYCFYFYFIRLIKLIIIKLFLNIVIFFFMKSRRFILLLLNIYLFIFIKLIYFTIIN